MSYCINPDCQNRQNPDSSQYCQACGTKLLVSDRYRLVWPLRELHKSPYVDVFEVDDSGIPKVLKILKVNDEDLLRLFRREAQALIQLRHSGIPKSGIPKVDPDGYFTFSPSNSSRELHCLVMEKIQGEDLQQWLKSNKRISEELVALEWLKQLTEVLDGVHQKRLFHRDIKPSNIMLRPNSDLPNGELVLIDFGAARWVTPTVVQGRRDLTGVFTPGYAAPEQLNSRPVPQSDFFALGRTFVHLLTGKHPIELTEDSQTGQLIWRDSAPQVSEPLANFIDELMALSVQKRPDNTQIILKRINALQRIDDLADGTTEPISRSRQPGLPWLVTGLSLGLLEGILLGSLVPPLLQPVASPQPCDSPAKEALDRKHEDDVNAIAFSPNGNYLATASLDNTARVWETTSRKQVACLPHKDNVVAVAFSPNGKYLATASLDKTVQVQEMSSGSIIHLQHEDGVVAVAFSRDGKYLATASADGNARVWKTTLGRRVALLPHNAYVRAVVFSPDGRFVATASLDNTARVWETTSGKQVKLLQHQDRVVSITFSRNGKYLATGSASGTAQVWEWETLNDKAVANQQHEGSLVTVAFSPDEKYLATASQDGTAQVWEWKATSGSKVVSVPQDKEVVAVNFSGDGKYLATASADGNTRVWDTIDVGLVAQEQYGSGLVAIAFSPDGQSLATASRDGTIQLWPWNKSSR
ncbi:protein kinase domain-containing protein [Funiculus sociatus]|uniref:protein kinase domain-containing protein n=1 Tax=Funiculus sociatus TaxID=450527 RepID=UPI003299EC15